MLIRFHRHNYIDEDQIDRDNCKFPVSLYNRNIHRRCRSWSKYNPNLAMMRSLRDLAEETNIAKIKGRFYVCILRENYNFDNLPCFNAEECHQMYVHNIVFIQNSSARKVTWDGKQSLNLSATRVLGIVHGSCFYVLKTICIRYCKMLLLLQFHGRENGHYF